MSDNVRNKNSSVKRVLNSLRDTNNVESSSAGHLDLKADTTNLLIQTNTSIKNLNHSLMKLVSTQ